MNIYSQHLVLRWQTRRLETRSMDALEHLHELHPTHNAHSASHDSLFYTMHSGARCWRQMFSMRLTGQSDDWCFLFLTLGSTQSSGIWLSFLAYVHKVTVAGCDTRDKAFAIPQCIESNVCLNANVSMLYVSRIKLFNARASAGSFEIINRQYHCVLSRLFWQAGLFDFSINYWWGECCSRLSTACLWLCSFWALAQPLQHRMRFGTTMYAPMESTGISLLYLNVTIQQRLGVKLTIRPNVLEMLVKRGKFPLLPQRLKQR